jgi:protease-4
VSTQISEDMRDKMVNQMLDDFIRERRAERVWKWVMRAFWLFLFVGLPIVYFTFIVTQLRPVGLPKDDVVGVVRLNGEIAADGMASANKVVPALRKAFEAKNVKAVLLSIDSPGGAPVEAERIYNAIQALKKDNPKPVIAVINNVGASAAYLVAIHCDEIYAGRYSLVGSIGAVLSSWDFSKAIGRFDVYQRVYASGDLKSMLNPWTPATPEADRKAHELVDTFGGAFIGELKQVRGKKLIEGFDYGRGEVWGGDAALKIGLIDGLGTIDGIAARKFKLPLHDIGPRYDNLPFLNSLAGEIADVVVSRLMGNPVNVR